MSKKIDHIQSAFSQLRISGLTVKPTAQHIEAGLYFMENMMAEYEDTRGLCVNYNFEDRPDVNSESGVNRSVNHAIETNVAIRLIPIFNKQVPQTLLLIASQSINALISKSLIERQRQVQAPGRMPVGSGYRYRNRFRRFERPEDLAINNCATNRMVVGEINDYSENFHAYLNGEIISTYKLSPGPGITLLSASISGEEFDLINYRAQAERGIDTHRHVVIKITTDSGRVEKRVIDFEIKSSDDPAGVEFESGGAALMGGSITGTAHIGG